MSDLVAVPLSRDQANDFILKHHLHHKPCQGDKFRVGVAADNGTRLCGVAMIGRPVSRVLDDGETVEVVRLCADGTKNACSFLYGRAAKIAKLMGYKRIITYILETEDGTTLKASGFELDGTTKGGSWDTPSRRRSQKAPTCKKLRWVKIL